MADEFSFVGGGEIVWRPSAEVIARSRLQQFMNRHGLSSFEELHRRSTDDVAWFWEAVLAELGIEFYAPYRQIVDLSRGIQRPVWCVDGMMNIVHNCLDKWQSTSAVNRAALRWEGEEGDVRVLTYGDLYREVNRLAAGLRALGLGKGDAIGLFLPMIPEVVIALLAIAKIGGVILPLFSGYGAGAVASRLADGEAKALFTADGFLRRGRVVPLKPVADEALLHAPTVQHVIVVNRAHSAIPWTEGRDHHWADVIAGQPQRAETERTSAEDVVMLIYTSGTTGRPKGAVHTHCGFPIKAAQDMAFGLDVHEDDTVYWMSDIGWMMGPWLVFGTLLLGATMVLYDGAPDFPDVDRTWALVAQHGVTALGVSPTLIRSLRPHGAAPVQQHDLSTLRLAGSTGSPWDPESWLWFFNTVLEGRKPIINYSGGTEISGGIVMGHVLGPLKPCAFTGPVPGMAADVVDDHGRSVRNQVGELIVRQPWIGMTRGFWRDPQRYLDTYWSRFPDVWVHGDWAAIDDDGLWYILGRSDDTIKVAGKRLGPAEIESVLIRHPAVIEAAVIGVPHEIKGQEVVCFCVLRPNYEANEALRQALQAMVIAEMGKALQPKAIKFVSALPKTRNAKVMHRVIRAAYLGHDPGDLSSLENPATVEAIKHAV